MIHRLVASSLVLVAGLLAACSTTEDSESSGAAQTQQEPGPYPTSIRSGMRRLSSLDPSNASVGDFGSGVRNQGSIASCASFSFVGLLENQMFNERGISPDISERFMIFSNFFKTGTLGGSPTVIAQFPNIVSNLGLLTEDAYPYAEVDANASRFEQDAAQGLQTDHSQPSLASAIEGTSNEGADRSEILQRAEFIGKLPAGPYPVTLPVKAILQPGAKVPELEFRGKLYSCFSAEGASAAPEAKRLKVTPREFLAMCFDLDPKTYFTCGWDLGTAAAAVDARLTPTGDSCTDARSAADALASDRLNATRKNLKLVLTLLERGEAALIGVNSPVSPNNLAPVWSTKNAQPGSGHAVLAVGYVTYDELTSTTEQSRGLLGAGLFDRFAACVEPAYAEKIAAGLPVETSALRDVRVASKLGERLKTEGGLIVFRNSWGASVQDLRIGLDGNQAMTFDYFVQSGLIVQGRSQPRVGGVAWELTGPSYCPATVDLPIGGAWLDSPDRAEQLKSVMRAQFVPATCPAP